MENVKPTYEELFSENLKLKKLIEQKSEVEDLLKNSEEKFRKAFNITAYAIGVSRLKDGLYVDVNNGFCEITGYNPEEVIGRTSFELNIWFDKQERENLEELLVKDKYIKDYELKIIRKDGKILTCLASAELLELSNEPYLIASLIDISKIKKIETELIQAKEKAEENELKFRTIFEGAPLGIFRSTINGHFIEVNQALADIFGFRTPEEMINSVSDIGEQLNIESNKKIFVGNQTFKTKISKFDNVYKRKNGEEFYANLYLQEFLDENGNRILEGIVEDVTQRREYENILKIAKDKAEESESSLRQILQQMPYPAEVCDNKGNALFVNQAFLDLFGIPSDELIIGKYNVFNDKLIQQINLLQDIQKVYNGQTVFIPELSVPLNHIENKYQSFKSTNVIHEIVMFPVFNNLNEIKLTVTIWKDITDRKKAEQELMIAKEKAEESDRLKMAFLNNMSHEIRTPLNAIVGFSGLVANPNQSPDKLEKFAEMIAENSEKLISIINDVIEISQIHSNQIQLKLSEIDFISFIWEIYRNFQRQAHVRNIFFTLHQNIPYKMFNIITDNEKLKRTLHHIIDNALKFTHKGSVSITCNLIDTLQSVPLNKSHLQISISDSGIGISKEMQKIIFEPFRQVETGPVRNYGGNGLGLSLAKKYIELLDGTIILQSEINKGSTFIITLPVSNEFRINNENVKQNQFTILIATNEFTNYQNLVEKLQDFHVAVLYAENGQKALDIVRNNTIDLIIMEIKMPVMDGRTAASLIKAFRPAIPIIAQSTFAFESEKEVNIGIFDDFISKPPINDELNEIIHKYLKR